VAYIPQIDGLRALAMLMVLAHHVTAIYLEDTHRLGTQHLPQDWGLIITRSPLIIWILNLWIGVPIFCAISGFVLTVPFARSFSKGKGSPSWRLYLLRRIIRMEPPYFLSMTFLFLLVMMPWRMGWKYALVMLHIFGPHYLASLVYLHAQIYGGPSWINGVAWTLEIELQFYLVLPVIAELFGIRNRSLRRLIFVILIVASACLAQFVLPGLHNSRLDFSILKQLQFFLAGMLLADVHLDPPKIFFLKPYTADALVVLFAGMLIYVLHWRPGFGWLEPFLIAAMFFAIFKAKWFAGIFSSPVLTFPGTLCYTIYLYHYFIAQRVMPFTIRLFPPVHALWLDAVVQVVLVLIPVLLVASVLYTFTERPFVVLSHTVANRFRPARTTTPASEVDVVSTALEGRL